MSPSIRARQIFPTLVQVGCLLSVAGSFIASSAHPLRLAGACQLLPSLERLVPPSHLCMHFRQWHLLTLWSPGSDHPLLPAPWSRTVRSFSLRGSCGPVFLTGFFDSGLRLRFCTVVRMRLHRVEAPSSSFVLVSLVY